ncbi:1516_t:CDS:2, partial [Ambispora leptoticha]
FTKDTELNKHKDIQKAVQEALSGKLLQLPSYLDDISENIQQMLSFTLPIRNKAHTKAVVTALHRIYQFDQLPEEYFANLNPLPKNLANLHPAPTIPNELDKILNYLKNNDIDTTQLTLPITDQKAASETLKILHQHFIVKTIPNSILALPPLPEPTWGIFSQ